MTLDCGLDLLILMCYPEDREVLKIATKVPFEDCDDNLPKKKKIVKASIYIFHITCSLNHGWRIVH